MWSVKGGVGIESEVVPGSDPAPVTAGWAESAAGRGLVDWGRENELVVVVGYQLEVASCPRRREFPSAVVQKWAEHSADAAVAAAAAAAGVWQVSKRAGSVAMEIKQTCVSVTSGNV